jgi:quercetin dioxygenase-like cupin family protein
MNAARLVCKGTSPALDVLGPTLEFLSPPTEGAAYCILRGTIPPGGCVPLHSHPDPEGFFVLSGAVQVLAERGDGLQWLDVVEGDFIDIPGGAKHAFRNASGGPVVQLITTTSPLGRFFQEIGRPVTGVPMPPPTPHDIERFTRAAARYGYWLGSPEENAAAGIPLPG